MDIHGFQLFNKLYIFYMYALYDMYFML